MEMTSLFERQYKRINTLGQSMESSHTVQCHRTNRHNFGVGVVFGFVVGFFHRNTYTLFLAGSKVPSQDRVHQQYRDFFLLNVYM